MHLSCDNILPVRRHLPMCNKCTRNTPLTSTGLYIGIM